MKKHMTQNTQEKQESYQRNTKWTIGSHSNLMDKHTKTFDKKRIISPNLPLPWMGD